MLTKSAIIEILQASPLDLSLCWVTAGAALVFHGLRQTTRDIDMGCEPSQAEELTAAGYPYVLSPEGFRRFHLDGNIDLSENFARGTVLRLEGIPVVSLEDVLLLKRHLNRPKDQTDITAIQQALQAAE